MVIVIILMSKVGFEDEGLVKLIVGVVNHGSMSPLMSLAQLTIEAAIYFCRQQLRRESQLFEQGSL
jgi:hypothetical protein